MFKHASSRNQRGRGLRMKSALKIFILVAICLWLLYQLKHSHDQKRAFEERNSNILSSTSNEDIRPNLFDSNRKVLPGIGVKRDHSDEAAVDDVERDHHSKVFENEDDETGTEGDAIDENDLENSDDGIDRTNEQPLKGNQERHLEKHGPLDNGDHSILKANSQEARERHYQEDDASSSVTRDSQTFEMESGGKGAGSSIQQQTENSEKKGFDFGNNGSNGTFDVDGSNAHLIENKHDPRHEKYAIDDEHTKNIEKRELVFDGNKSNATVGQNGDHLPASILMDGNGTTSSSLLPPSSAQVETNPIISDVVSESSVEMQNNTLLVAHKDTNATISLDSADKVNSTVKEGAKIDDNLGPEDVKGEPAKDIIIMQVDSNNMTATMKELHENSTSSLFLPSTKDRDMFSMVPTNSSYGLPSQELTILPVSIHKQNTSEISATQEGQGFVPKEDGSSHAETNLTAEVKTFSTTSNMREPEASLPTYATADLNESILREFSGSSNSKTSIEANSTLIYLPSMHAGDAINKTSAEITGA